MHWAGGGLAVPRRTRALINIVAATCASNLRTAREEARGKVRHGPVGIWNNGIVRKSGVICRFDEGLFGNGNSATALCLFLPLLFFFFVGFCWVQDGIIGRTAGARPGALNAPGEALIARAATAVASLYATAAVISR